MDNIISNNFALKQNKNYGIELLRIVAIVFVVTLHVVTFGGILPYTELQTQPVSYIFLTFLKVAAYGCVDLFALISGFVCINSKWASKRFLKLWFCVVFWGVVLLLILKFVPSFFDFLKSIFNVFIPNLKESFPDYTVGAQEFLANIFTIGTKQYWYFNMYTLLIFFMPILNAGIQKLNKKHMAMISLGFFVFACVYKTIVDKDIFALSGGYSAMWLIILYFIGATARKYYDEGFKIKKWICLLGFLISTLITLAWQVGCDYLSIKYPDIEFFSKYDDLLISYVGPFVVLGCVFLLLLFMQIQVKRKVPQKITDFFAKAAFGTYIVHVHTAFWDYFLPNRFYTIANESTPLLILHTIIAIIIFYLICTLLETIRILIFKYTRFDKLINLVGDSFDKLLFKIFKYKKEEEQIQNT